MANKTVGDAGTVHGANPQFLVEKIIRTRIYDTLYWKEHCFALTAETVIDKAVQLDHIGGVYGGSIKPTPFLCLTLKLLQLAPDKDIIYAYIAAKDFKYLQALGVFYLRLVGTAKECYSYLEPFLEDFRKLRHMKRDGQYELMHMDEFVDQLLREDRVCDIILPRLMARYTMELNDQLAPRVSALQAEFEEAEAEEQERQLAAEAQAKQEKSRSDGDRHRYRSHSRSRSRSPQRRYSRSPRRYSRSPRRRYSRSPSPRRRSRSPVYRRSRSRSPPARRRSRSPDERRRRTRSPSPYRRRRSYSRSPSPRRRSYSRSPSPRRETPLSRDGDRRTRAERSPPRPPVPKREDESDEDVDPMADLRAMEAAGRHSTASGGTKSNKLKLKLKTPKSKATGNADPAPPAGRSGKPKTQEEEIAEANRQRAMLGLKPLRP